METLANKLVSEMSPADIASFNRHEFVTIACHLLTSYSEIVDLIEMVDASVQRIRAVNHSNLAA